MTVADAEAYAAWGDDAEFRRVAEWSPRPYDELVAQLRLVAAAPPPALLRLTAEVDGEVVGYADLHGLETDRRELGFLVGPRERWGNGIGRAVAEAGLRHGFDELGLREVWAEARPTNTASVRILRGLMAETGPSEDGEWLRFAVSR